MNNSEKQSERDICFLIGAGVSQAAGLPSGEDITNTILSGQGYQSDDMGGFCIPHPDEAWPEGHNEEVLSVIKFLRVLFEVVGEYETIDYNPEPSFEDLFFLVDQMFSVTRGEYENPALLCFLDCIKKKTLAIVDKAENQMTFDDLVESSHRYIRDVAAKLVSIGDYDTSKCHRVFLEAILSQSVNVVDLFSLNFDLLLEHSLESNDIPFTRGFERSDNSIRFWNPSVYENNPNKVRLFKLHGSINWYRYEVESSLGLVYKVGIKSNRQDDNSRITKVPLIDRPILVGTINKLIEYSNNVFNDLKCLFWSSLQNRNILIVAGYSFGDKGINNQIINWLSNDNKILIVIHPKFKELNDSARHAIKKLFNKPPQNKFGIIEKCIEKVSWLEIEEKITEMQRL